MQFDNSIYPQPNFSAHRRGVAANDPAISPANLTALMAGSGVNGPDGNPLPAGSEHGARRAADAKGWDTLVGYIELSIGTATVQPLLVSKYRDPATNTIKQRFVVLGSAFAGLADGDEFVIPNVHGGRVFLHITGLTGTAAVYLAGGERANEGSI
jgi:hypothetical protein